jgi:hypothetical protein
MWTMAAILALLSDRTRPGLNKPQRTPRPKRFQRPTTLLKFRRHPLNQLPLQPQRTNSRRHLHRRQPSNRPVRSRRHLHQVQVGPLRHRKAAHHSALTLSRACPIRTRRSSSLVCFRFCFRSGLAVSTLATPRLVSHNSSSPSSRVAQAASGRGSTES